MNPELVENAGIINIINNQLKMESNPNVMATAFYTLMDISNLKFRNKFKRSLCLGCNSGAHWENHDFFKRLQWYG